MKKGKGVYVRDYTCDAGATRRRVEKVCEEVEGLIGRDASGVTVEVEGRRCGEIKARLEARLDARGIVVSISTAKVARTAGRDSAGGGAETTVDGRVVVKRNGAVV